MTKEQVAAVLESVRSWPEQAQEELAREIEARRTDRGAYDREFVYPLSMNDLLSRITIRAEQCHGQPCIRGMRIRVIDVLEMLAGGMTHAEILADYPYLKADDIRACLAYAAQEMNHPVVTAAE